MFKKTIFFIITAILFAVLQPRYMFSQERLLVHNKIGNTLSIEIKTDKMSAYAQALSKVAAGIVVLIFSIESTKILQYIAKDINNSHRNLELKSLNWDNYWCICGVTGISYTAGFWLSYNGCKDFYHEWVRETKKA